MEIVEMIISNLHFANSTWEFMLPLILIVADVVTGLIQAFINNNFESKKMREGLYHKVLEVIMIGLGFICSLAFDMHAIHVTVVIYVTMMELGSILENLYLAGIDFGPLSKILKVMGKDRVADALKETIEEKNKN